MKKFIKFLFIAAVIFSVIVGIKFLFFKDEISKANLPLTSVKVSKNTISITISATGTLEPLDQVEVGTQVSGDISRIFVDFNSKVKKGQVIAELDKSKLKSTLTQAEIAYKSAVTDYKYKEAVYNRVKKLAESNSASAVELETAEYNRDASELAVARSKNEVEQARLNLGYATIKSPIDGIVLKRSVEVGQTVAASMSTPTLFVIAKDLSQMKVMASVDEADIGQVKQKQPVEFTVDAFPGETFKGHVQEVRLNPTVTSNVVTYTVVISAENPGEKLLPGMTATCNVTVKEAVDVLTIPARALKFTPAEGTPQKTKNATDLGKNLAKSHSENPPKNNPNFLGDNKKMMHSLGEITPKKSQNVWINFNGEVERRPVKIGLNDGVNVEVLEGLNLTDSVVISQESFNENPFKKESAKSPFMPGPPGKKKK